MNSGKIHGIKRMVGFMAGVLMATTCFFQLPPMAVEVYAAVDPSQKTITGLGTGTIENPMPGPEHANSRDEWSGSYVHYGKFSNYIYCVLTKSTSDFGTPSMLLNYKYILMLKEFDDTTNVWGNSSIRTYLNDSFLNDFSAAEKEAMIISRKDDTQLGAMNDKIFLLDADDVINRNYGFCGDFDSQDGARIKNKDPLVTGYLIMNSWILRTLADSNGRIWAIAADGRPGTLFANYAASSGISPAFNLNLSAIIFSSLVSSTTGYVSAEYKLTISDNNISIVSGNGISTAGDYTVTVPYTISGNNRGSVNRVSVLLTKDEYTPGVAVTNTNETTNYTYLQLSTTIPNSDDSNSATRTSSGTFTLPESYRSQTCGTDYHAYLIAEDVNEDKETDYASLPGKASEFRVPAPTYAVTVETNSSSWGSVSSNKTTASAGDEVSVSAIAKTGYVFSHWIGTDGVTFADATSKSTTFTMPAKSVTISANFTNDTTISYDETGLAVMNGHTGFNASLTGSTATVKAGEDISVDYSGAVANASGNEYVSAMLCDSDGMDVLYYGKLKQIKTDADKSGTLSVTIPSSVTPGDYKLKIFSEQYNGDNMTDLTGKVIIIDLNILECHKHSYTGSVRTSATYTETGVMTYTCSCSDNCMSVVPIAPGNHDFDEGTVTTPATVLADGVKTYTCKRCGATKTESIPKLEPATKEDKELASQIEQIIEDLKGDNGELKVEVLIQFCKQI